jgi:hypothetical protein
MKLRIIALLFGVLSCAAAWCQSSQSDPGKPASTSSTKSDAPVAKADASAEQPSKANIAPAFILHDPLLDNLHMSSSADDACPKGTQRCDNANGKNHSCCSTNQDCNNCDGTCQPKGTAHKSC